VRDSFWFLIAAGAQRGEKRLIQLPDWAIQRTQVIIYSMEAGFALDLLPIPFNFC